jgi:hypothetical protein
MVGKILIQFKLKYALVLLVFLYWVSLFYWVSLGLCVLRHFGSLPLYLRFALMAFDVLLPHVQFEVRLIRLVILRNFLLTLHPAHRVVSRR